MARGHLGHVHVRRHTDVFKVAHAVVGKSVVEILGHGVRVEPQPLAEYFRRADAHPLGDLANVMHERRDVFTFGDLRLDRFGIAGLEDVVEIRE